MPPAGRGSHHTDSNSDLYKVGRLLYENGCFGAVEFCYIAIAQPDLPAGVERCVRLGFRRVVAVPHMLFSGRWSSASTSASGSAPARIPA